MILFPNLHPLGRLIDTVVSFVVLHGPRFELGCQRLQLELLRIHHCRPKDRLGLRVGAAGRGDQEE